MKSYLLTTPFLQRSPSHGGVLIAVNNKFPCQEITLPENLETILILPCITLCVTDVLPTPLLTIMIVCLTFLTITSSFRQNDHSR